MKVFKYPIPVPLFGDIFTIYLPFGAEILHFAAQGDNLCLWCLVDPAEKNTKQRLFHVAGTGHEIEGMSPNWKFIGTCLMLGGALVWHLWEIVDE